MIEKLESAGLGFYVKATETQQKLGSFQITKYLYWYDCISIISVINCCIHNLVYDNQSFR